MLRLQPKGETMKYRVTYGCPRCGNRAIRMISSEKYERLTRKKPTGTAYQCRDAETYGPGNGGCGHVWTVEKTALTR